MSSQQRATLGSMCGRGSRRGVTILEMAIVVAIFGIMAALAGQLLNEVIPSWRTRKAAYDFAVRLNEARNLAVSQNTQYRIALRTYDAAIDDFESPNAGQYTMEAGDEASNSFNWDILPIGAEDGGGLYDLSAGTTWALGQVSIAAWTPIAGPTNDGMDDIVFNGRGWLDNPASDFVAGDGYILITFVNKKARSNGTVDQWTVKIARTGTTRIEADEALWVPSTTMGDDTISTPSSDPTGYVGGGEGSSEDEEEGSEEP